MSSYTPAQKRAWAKKMQAAKAAKNRAITGRGAYKSKSKGGGGRHYYEKYKTAKAASAAAPSNEGGWLSSGLGAVGDMLPIPFGGAIGRGVGSLIKSITGFGDYDVSENSLIKEAGAPPAVKNYEGKIFVVRHREYISDIISSSVAGAFKIENYFINPGDGATFPWLKGVAANYEHYQIRGMLFEFRSMSADALNSTNTALGQVIMATQYNSATPNFSNKYEMENYEFGQSIKPSESCMHPIECARSESVLGDLYIRPGSLPAGEDRRLYDFGNFQVASNGVQGTSVNLGELWVTYEIALYKPKLVTATGDIIPVFQAHSNTGIDNTHAMGTTQSPAVANTLGITLSGPTVSFPSSVKYGTYYCRYRLSGAVTALSYGATAIGSLVNCTANQVVLNPAANPATQDGWDTTFRIDVTGAAPSFGINIAASSIPTSPNATLTIVQVPLGFVPISSW